MVVIRGVVNARLEAIVRLRIRGSGSQILVVDAVIDTGFSASLSLPAGTVAALGLAWQSSGEAIMADGSVRQFDIYEAEVEWDGGWRPILVSAVGSEALLGMRMLTAHQLQIEVVPGGAVKIRRGS